MLHPFFRVLLWTLVVVAPGGLLLLPFFAFGPMKGRTGEARVETQPRLEEEAPV